MTKQDHFKMKKSIKMIVTFLMVLLIVLLFLTLIGTAAEATGLVDNTVDNANAYSRYPLENYQLDFYVDNSWNWLPWNWADGIGQQVMYGLYAITNFIWIVNLYLSNATGYLVQEAYALDFISDTVDAIGENMQILAGVTRTGFSNEGFYVGFLLLLILIIGIYVTYTGLLKRETTKAVQGGMNFLVVFLLSSAFIAYAPDTINRINDFSSDISQASLSLGTRITLPNSESGGNESVDLIRDSLFSIQVRQPWLLLQYGTNDEEELGGERIETLLSTSPSANGGEDRENIVIEEIEERNNPHLTITQTANRLGVVFFISLFNIGISIFVFLLTGIMIFSQILFIIYAMFLPISFLLSMIPTFGHMSKRALTKLFNTILARAGITLILTIAFSLSSMLYSLSTGYPFFLIAFLQIVTFAGIYFRLSDLMGMFALQSNDSQSIGKRVMRKPRLLMHTNMHRLQRKVGRSLTLLGAGAAASKVASKKGPTKENNNNHTPTSPSTSTTPSKPRQNEEPSPVNTKHKNTKAHSNMNSKNKRIAQTSNSIHPQSNTPRTEKKATQSKENNTIKKNRTAPTQSTSPRLISKEQRRQSKKRKTRLSVAQRRLQLDKNRKVNTSEKRRPLPTRPSTIVKQTSTPSTQRIKNQLKKQHIQNKPLIKRKKHHQRAIPSQQRPLTYKKPPTTPTNRQTIPSNKRRERKS